MLNAALTFAGLLTGVVATVVAVRSWNSQKKQQREQEERQREQDERQREQQQQLEELQATLRGNRQRFTWEDIYERARDLAKELASWNPDCLLVGNGAPLIVASMAVEELYWWLPVYPFLTASNEVQRIPEELPPGRYVKVPTTKRTYYLPQALLDHRPKRIAILDDVAFDTLFFHSVIEELKKWGYSRDDLFTATLIASRVVHESKVLNWTFERVSHLDIFLPWGPDRASNHERAADSP